MNELFENAVRDISLKRAQIIEDYIRFWLAQMVPDAYLTPEYLAENFELCMDTSDYKCIRYWMRFKENDL